MSVIRKQAIFHLLLILITIKNTQAHGKSNYNGLIQILSLSTAIVSTTIACAIILVFLCIKYYFEYRYRNVVTTEPSPGLSRDIVVSNLTLLHRKAVLNTLFSVDKCKKFQKVRGHVKMTKKLCCTNIVSHN